jgi:hypothetical protein
MDDSARQVFALRSSRYALFVFTVVVWGWGFLFLSSLRGIPVALSFLLPAVGALPLLILSLRFSRRLRGLEGPAPFASKRMRAFYLLVVVLEVIGYVVIVQVTRALHHYEYTAPAATILIGLHFLALIPVFHEKRYYLTTLVFCLAGIVPVFLVPNQFTLGSVQVISGWQLVTSPICWLWLWGQAIYLLMREGRRLPLVQAHASVQPAAAQGEQWSA